MNSSTWQQQAQHWPRYDPGQTYQWNYDHAPEVIEVPEPPVPERWEFLGHRVESPLGVAAGPLLNARWLLYYAHLGFDILVYKTVRSRAWPCYPLPNLVPVECESLQGNETVVRASPQMRGTWAVSFGMPSQEPEVWRRDVAWAREKLPPGKVLCVSVVGTGKTLQELQEDYAQVARWATQAGAQVVEANFSCPNVCTPDGQLYRSAEQSAQVAQAIREAIGPEVPLVIKIGHVVDARLASQLVQSLQPWAQALAMTNSVAAQVQGPNGRLLFEGQRRGICGRATFAPSLKQLKLFAQVVQELDSPMKLIAVGGADSWPRVREYLQAGACSVHLATAVMVRPQVGLEIRQQWAKQTVQGT